MSGGRLESKGNPRIRLYRGLERREARIEAGLMAAEGIRLVVEALRSPLRVPDLFLSDDLEKAGLEDIMSAVGSRGGETAVWRIPSRVFKGMAHTLNPQGAAATVELPPAEPDPGGLARGRGVVVLHQPRDPGNVGTVLRCVEAASFDAVVVVGPSCDPFNPKAVRASMGSVFRVPLQRWGSCAEVAGSLATAGFQVLAADPRSTAVLWDLPTRSPLAVVFGGETTGLPDLGGVPALRFSLPMGGRVESLNLAMAVAATLYEIRRRAAAAGG